MTKHFAKWAKKQNIPDTELASALNEVENGIYETNLGGYIIKKRIRFQGRGKSGSRRTIICYKHADRAFFFMALLRMKNRICLPKNFMPSRNWQRFYCHFPMRN